MNCEPKRSRIAAGPTINTPMTVAPPKPKQAATVKRTLRPKSPEWAALRSVTIRRVRWGRSVVETAWKS